MTGQLVKLLQSDRRPRVLVVGDVMLDRYVFGDVARISPEGPIPVLKVARQEHRLGGAGSVAAMLAAWEAEVSLIGLTGDDPEADLVRGVLEQIGVGAEGLVSVPGRATTVKERLLGRTHSKHSQQMIRVDREDDRALEQPTADRLLEAVKHTLGRVDLVLVSDYDKGVCAGRLVPQVAEAARALRVPVVADPVRGVDFARYTGCTCITPNRIEAAAALGLTIETPEQGLSAVQQMLEFGVEAAVLTLDKDGIAWADRRGGARLFGVRQRQVYDITGAGDMVLSALGYALAAGADYPTAIDLANLAGGLEVERLGVVPVTRGELLAELRPDGEAPQKIIPLEPLLAELRRRRQRGEQIVMTNGCFDLLHPGHVASLRAARRHGDVLVVGLNSDRSVRELKGPGHPIVDQQGRAEMLAALACVDYVVLFDEASVAPLLERVLPDVLVKAAEYTIEEVVGHEIVQQHGGRVVLVPIKGEYSTSAVIERIRGQ